MRTVQQYPLDMARFHDILAELARCLLNRGGTVWHATILSSVAVGKPVMVHGGGTTIGLDEILGTLNTGDTVTHCFHDRSEGVLDEHGKLRASVRHAVERGINVDVGHGRGSFDYGVARAALHEGLLPGTISADIHAWNIAGPVYDLATTASKFLHLGVSLNDVVRRVTINMARAVGMEDTIGALAPGAAAGLILLRLASGEWHYEDSTGNVEVGRQRLEPVRVIRTGQQYHARQRCTPQRTRTRIGRHPWRVFHSRNEDEWTSSQPPTRKRSLPSTTT